MSGKSWAVLGVLFVFVLLYLISGYHDDRVRPEATTYAPAAVTYTPPPAATPTVPSPSFYVVQCGDGLKAIADAHAVTLGALLQADGFADSSTAINPGDVLIIPSATAPAGTAPARALAAAGSPTSTTPSRSVVGATAPTYAAPTPAVSTYRAPAGDWASTCPDGNCFGQISPTTGEPRTDYVQGYTRKNGTHVGGYYRSHRR